MVRISPLNDYERYLRKWISRASYEELLYKKRFYLADHSIFQGQLGLYFANTIHLRRLELSDDEVFDISRKVGRPE